MRNRAKPTNPATEVAKDPREVAAAEARSQIGPTLGRLFKYVLHDKGKLVLALGLILLSVIVSAALPVLMGQAINIIGGSTGLRGSTGMDALVMGDYLLIK